MVCTHQSHVTPLQYEWLRMPSDLQNAPKIYQRPVDNALYGYLKIGKGLPRGGKIDVVKEGERETDRQPSILGGDPTSTISLHWQDRGILYTRRWKEC